MTIRDQIANILLTLSIDDLDDLSLASTSPDTHEPAATAHRLAGQILDLIARTHPTPHPLSEPLPIPTNSPSVSFPIRCSLPTDTIPLAHDDPDDIVFDLAGLCNRAGLTYHGIGFAEGRPVVIATDDDGLREYYTIDVLTAMADPSAAANSAEGNPKSPIQNPKSFVPVCRRSGQPAGSFLLQKLGRAGKPAPAEGHRR